MPDTAKVITSLYEALDRHDGDAMAALYADGAKFSDPVFGPLDADQVRAMWRMLCKRGKDLRVETSNLQVDGESGTVHWDAYYTFAATKRHVHNSIDASIRVVDGKIVEHHDVFSFWRWSRQALGVPGMVLGWSGALRGKVRAKAHEGLAAFMAQPGATD